MDDRRYFFVNTFGWRLGATVEYLATRVRVAFVCLEH
jgi:hypothetical protein